MFAEVEKVTFESVRTEMDKNPPLSKYAAKKLSQAQETVFNADKIRKNKAVSLNPRKAHNKVSKSLHLTLQAEQQTVVCDETGIVSVLNIPKIPGKVLTWGSPLAYLPNARGIVQEGHDYLASLESQIVAGLFLTLASEYELIRTIPSATGAENNAILRTAGKEKLIQACILVESYIHSNNHVYQPKLSLIYDETLREYGIEPRLTEWMRLVEDAIEKPDLSEYDENAVLSKPMRSIADLKKDYTEHRRQLRIEEKKNSPAAKLTKARAQFRKDIKEAKMLLKSLKDTLSFKLLSFLNTLCTEETFLQADQTLIGQIIVKLESYEEHSAKRLVEILNVDRSDLRKENSIDDFEDILMAQHAEKAEEAEVGEGEEAIEADMQQAYKPEPFTGEFEEIKEEDKVVTEELIMPAGLSKVQQILWKRRNQK